MLERVAVTTNYCYIGNNKMHPGETITLVVVNKTVIKGNWNIVPYTDINIAAQVHAKKPKAISTFAAGMTVMTVIFSQRNYSANVLLLNGDWDEDIGGVFDGLAIIFINAPVGNTSVTVISYKFHHNLYHGKIDLFRIGCMDITTFNDKSTHHTTWDAFNYADSKMEFIMLIMILTLILLQIIIITQL